MAVDKEVLNQSIRRFLKEVGIKSHQQLEQQVLAAVEAGLTSESIEVSMTLTLPSLNHTTTISGRLALRDQ
ncbi:hypothetical protein SAMN04488540_101464 [Ferrimonas sediminum]|uniref:Uncharacterized protein n=1 Tax=Ferrimonas sediminum TaxID=718193 RepID=A0A1G8KRX3_9GAMM|nr:DUF6494 family protein [Ferrimonas sediminum]SDI46137.1 hypothetical protein SAMN04488540_101464 [Ferrimonas sediminum]